MAVHSTIFRKHHRILSIFVFVPLVVMAVTGMVSPILEAFHLEQATIVVRRIHSGKIFFGSTYPVYTGAIGLALLGLLVTGLSLLKRHRRPQIRRLRYIEPDRSQEERAVQPIDPDPIRLVLYLLLPANERQHLVNLLQGKTTHYEGNCFLYAELQHLQALHLISIKQERSLGEIGDGLMFNLADYVELTSVGQEWTQQIPEIEKI